MEQYNIHEAKTHFSKLIAKIEAGEEVIIAKAGKPLGRLVLEKTEPRLKQKRQLGGWEGKIWMAPDWDSPEVNAQIAEDFYGNPDKFKDL